MSSRWSANKDKEKNKLAPKESDWNLPGSGGLTATRTRRGGLQNQAVTAASNESQTTALMMGIPKKTIQMMF